MRTVEITYEFNGIKIEPVRLPDGRLVVWAYLEGYDGFAVKVDILPIVSGAEYAYFHETF